MGASLAWGGGSGALLAFGCANIGAGPGALTGLVSALAVGAGLGLLVRPRQGRRGARAARVVAALAALVIGWSLPWAWPWPLVPAAIGAAALASVFPSAHGAPVLVLGAFSCLAGFHAPAVGGLLVLAGAAVDLRREPFRTPLPQPGTGPLAGALWLGAATWVATGAWSVSRALLDPTPAGFLNALAAFCLVAGLAMPLTRALRPFAAPLLGLAAAGTYAWAAGLPGIAWDLLAPLAGEADPRRSGTLLAVAGMVAPAVVAAVGAASLVSRTARGLGLVAAGVGVALGPVLGPDTGGGLVVLGLAGGALALLRGPGGWGRLAGVSVLAITATFALAFTWPEQVVPEGRFTHLRDKGAPEEARLGLERSERLAGGWGPEGAVLSVQTPEGRLVLHLDGLPRAPDDRSSDAAALAAHLAASLSERRDRSLVLGDETSRALEALLAQGLGLVEVAVPNAGAVRALVDRHADAEAAHFQPAVRHRRGPLAWTLRSTAPVDALVEVAAAPWWDSHQQLPRPQDLQLRARRLAPGGVYALVVPALWLEADELATLGRAFADTFAWSALALPPVGLDQVVLIGRDAPPRWELLEAGSERATTALGELGLGTPWALAGRVAVDHSGLSALAGDDAPTGLGLPPTLHRRPRLHAPLLRDHLIDPADAFAELSEQARAALAGSRESHDRLLDFYEHVGRGEIPELAEDAQALTGTSHERALDELVRPMTEAARSSIERGFSEGPGSTAWDQCIAELTQAQLFHPRSGEVLALLGECYLQKGNLPRAARLLDQSLQVDPYALSTLLAAARVSLARGEEGVAEAHLRAAAERHALDWRGHYDLGKVLFERGLLDEADDELRLAVARAGRETHLPILALARLELRRGRPDRALTHAERAVEIAPEHPDALIVRGRCYFELGQLDQAERDFRKAVLEYPDACEARMGMGAVSASRGDFDAAVDSFKRAVACDPGSVAYRQALDEAQALLD